MTDQQKIDDAESFSIRAAAMERTIRKLRVAVFALATCQTLWFLLGAAQQENQKASRFTIIDKAGKPRIEMGTDDAGNPSINIKNQDGVNLISMHTDIFGSFIDVSAANGRGSVLQVTPDGSSSLLLDAGGPNIRMVTLTGPPQQRSSYIAVADDDVKSQAWIATQSGGSVIEIDDKNGTEPVILYADEDGTSGVAVRDKNGIERIQALIDPNGNPKLRVLDKDGKEVEP